MSLGVGGLCHVAKGWHWSEFENIFLMQIVDAFFDICGWKNAFSEIIIQHLICESKIVFVGFSAQSVRWCFVNEFAWNTEVFSNCFDFFYCKV